MEAYEELLKLQAGLPNQNAAARAAGPGETHKLLGNLLLARRDFEGAGEHYGEALQLARAAFGQEHPKTQDLVKRLSSLQVRARTRSRPACGGDVVLSAVLHLANINKCICPPRQRGCDPNIKIMAQC